MKAAGFGRIVLLSSRGALGLATRTAYAATKAGMLGMARTWALELAPHGITVNVVAPGPVQTDMFHGVIPVGDPKVAQIAASIPVKRLGQPADVAHAVRFFCRRGGRLRHRPGVVRVRWHQRREPDPMKIAVLGGGHGCYAAAADLSDAGHEVRLWRRDAAALAPVQSGGIRMKDQKGPRDVRIALASGDIGAVLRGAELVLIPSPAIAQDDIARAMAPHLVDGQVVFLPPGTFGSVTMDRIVRASGNAAEVTYAETGTLPWLTRKHGAAEVAITMRAIHLPTGVYPQARSAHALAVIGQAFPGVIEDCGDALSGALMNAGPIIHPPLILMNAAPLQHFERWDIHNEGTQPAVRAVTSALDAERMATREALGYGAPHFPLADHYENDRWMYGDAHKKLTDSGDWRERIDLHTHRYMLEDTVLGLAFLCSVARYAGVDAPVAHGLLALAGAILGRDLRQGPRTFDALGLAALPRATLQARLQAGGL